MSQAEAPDDNSKEEAERAQDCQATTTGMGGGKNWRLVAERSKERTRGMQAHKASTADRQGGQPLVPAQQSLTRRQGQRRKRRHAEAHGDAGRPPIKPKSKLGGQGK
jgi:hypothetical protein